MISVLLHPKIKVKFIFDYFYTNKKDFIPNLASVACNYYPQKGNLHFPLMDIKSIE